MSGFHQHVGDRIAHAEVSRDRPVEYALKDGEDVGSGSSYVDADHLDVFLPGNFLHQKPDCAWRRHYGDISPAHEFLVTRSVLHHVFHEELVDLVSRWLQVLPLHHGPDVVHYVEGHFVSEDILYVFSGILVAGIYHRQLIPHAEPGPGICRRDELCQLYHVFFRSPVDPTGQEDHIRPEPPDEFNPFVGKPSVIGSYHLHDDGPGAQSGSGGALGRHRFDDSGHKHLKASSRRRRGDIDVHSLFLALGRFYQLFAVQYLLVRELFYLSDRIQHATGHVLERRLDGGGSLAPGYQSVAMVLFLNGYRFGRGTSTIRSYNTPDFLLVYLHESPPIMRNYFKSTGPIFSSLRRSLKEILST